MKIIQDIQFVPVNLSIHRTRLIDLNVEYLTWVLKEIEAYYNIALSNETGSSLKDYITNNIEKMCSVVPNQAVFYLLKLDKVDIGMGGLRRARKNIGEIKRMYIKPIYRGKGWGRTLLKRLIQKAGEFGYKRIYLDTGEFMTAAQHLYRSLGFVEREEYPETEVPEQVRSKWLFMEKILLAP